MKNKRDNNELGKLTKMTIAGMAWKMMEKIGGQLMQIAIQIILARLLLPEEYGLVGLLTIFIIISDVFISQGLTTALIQKIKPSEDDMSSVFFANIVISVVLYGILYGISPYVAEYYNEPQLKNIMRVLSLNIIIGAFSAVHNAILSRELDFKKSFIRNLANISTQGFVGISLALMGLGAWAMAFSKISGSLIGTIVLCITVDWKPKPIFKMQCVKNLFSYSSKILITNLLNTLFNNLPILLIGRHYSTKEVGFFQRGQQIPQALMVSFDGSLAEVLYPAFSRVQDNVEVLKAGLRKAIGISMFISLPVLWGLLVIAEPLTIVLLTEKWLPSVPIMQLACIACMFWPLSHRVHALNARGLSHITLKLSVISKVLTLLALLFFIKQGIYAIMIGNIISSIISMFITTAYVDKHIGYSLKELSVDILPPLLLSIAMGIVVFLIGLININIYISLLLQIFVGIIIYVYGAYIFKFEAFNFVLMQLKSKKNNYC